MKRAPHTSPRPALALAACAVLLTLAGLRVHAANALSAITGGTAASAAAPDAPEPEPVPTASIAARADTDERFIQDIIRRARQQDATARLGPGLDAIDEGSERLTRSYTSAGLAEMSVVRLESIERYWNFYDRQLREWRRELTRVASPASEDAAALSARRASWEATRQALAGGGAATALTVRVDGILAQIATAERALSKPLDAQIRLGRRANAVQDHIDAGHKTIDAAIEQHDRRLATIDASPIWTAWQNVSLTGRDLRGAGAGLGIELAFLDEWQAATRGRIVGYGIAVVVALALLLWLARRTREAAVPDPATLAASRVLRRPISAWLVLALVGLPLVLADAPAALHQFSLLVAVVPVLRLLPPRVYAVLGPWPYAATAIYLAYHLSFLLLGEPPLHRLYLLAVAVVSAVALVWLLLGSRGAGGSLAPDGTEARTQRVVRMLGWAAVTALAAAVVANVAGNVSLCETLTGGVIDSGYLGLALYAGSTVLTSVLHLLAARRAASRLRLITQHTGPLLESLDKLIMLAALVAWVIATANEFRIARPVMAALDAVLNHPLEAGKISLTLGSILLFVGAVWISFWVAGTVRLVLRDEVMPKMALPRGVANSVATLSYYGLVILGLLFALAAAGFETGQFAIVFGALGVGIGFGLQNVVNNFVSGLILMFERPIQPGDIVEVSGTSGKVRDIGMRATTLTTFEGADVVVPNGTLLSEKLINWTLSDMNRRIDVDIGVSYDAEPRRVLELLAEVARGTPGIAPEPAPAVLFAGFGASALEFGIRAWTNNFGDWVAIRTEMNARVLEALRREGIEIPFPQQDLHLRSVSAEAAARFAVEAPNGRPGAGSGTAAPAATQC